jgi:hypothetical protein
MKNKILITVVMFTSFYKAQSFSDITIDPLTVQMPNSKFLLGITMDSRTGMLTNNGTSMGYFNPDGSLIPELVPLFSDFPVSTTRYPANGIIVGFDWKKSIGLPASSRPTQALMGNLGPAQAVEFGFDEFMDWTFSKGISPQDVQIMVSIYDSAVVWNDPVQQQQALPNIIQHCADWVEYANAPNDGLNPGGGIDWASRRSANGHDAPYGIKIWNMGNEPWAGHEFGASTSGCDSYLTIITPIIDAMLAIDSTLQITLATVGTSLNSNTWHSRILNSPLVASGKVYGLSPHAFPVESGALTKVSNFVSIYGTLADSAQVHGLKIILGDYAQGIPQTPPTQAEQDIAMQWQGTILSADFLMGMSKINNLERVGFWAYGTPLAIWHPIRKLNGVHTLMPVAQLYKKLSPLVLDHSLVSTNSSSAGSDGNPYGVNSSAFASSDGSLVNVIAVNRDLVDNHLFTVNGITNYNVQNATLLSATAPTDEVILETNVSPDANGNFSIPPMSILILEHVLNSADISKIKNSPSNLVLFPNPTTSQLNFSNYLEEFIITNSLGKEILKGKGNSVSIAELKDGIYFLKTDNTCLRFVVKH